MWLFFFPSRAQTLQGEPAQWVRIGPEGGEISALAVDPVQPATIYAGTVEGVYKSKDGGSTWAPSNHGLGAVTVTGLGVDPGLEGKVFATTLDALYISTDSGASWEKAQGLPSAYFKDPIVSAAAPADIFVGGTGPYRSLDGGATWDRLDHGIETDYNNRVAALAATATAPLRLYAGTSFGLFRSDDYGDSWQKLDAGPNPPRNVEYVSVDPGDPDRIFVSAAGKLLRSLDGGSTFVQGAGVDNSVFAVAYDSRNPQTVYCAGYEGVFRSQDNGLNWARFVTDLPRRIDLSPIAAFSLLELEQPSPRLLLGTGTGTYALSFSSGRWSPSRTGLTPVSVRQVRRHPLRATEIYVATGPGLYNSLDSGRSWKVVLNERIDKVSFDPNDPERVYAGGGAFFRTTDGGIRWSRHNIGIVSPVVPRIRDVGGMGIDPSNPRHLFSAGDHFAFQTLNGGDTWQMLGYIPGFVNELVIDPKSPQTLLVATNNGLFKSVDGGSHWGSINQGLESFIADFPAIAVQPEDPAKLYAGSRTDGVFRSSNGGAEWTQANVCLVGRNVGAILIDPRQPSTLYVGTDAGVERSVDSGMTWSLLATEGLEGLPVRSLSTESSSALAPTILLAGTERGGVARLEMPSVGTFAQFGDGASDSDKLSSEIILLNTDEERPANATLLFRDKNGARFDVGFGGVLSEGRLDVGLPPKSVRFLKTDGDGALRAGWAALHSDRPLEGVVVFESGAGAAGVGRSASSMTRFEIPVRSDSARRIRTGLAIANLLPTPNRLELELLDTDHTLLADAQILLPGMGQSALFVDQIAWQGLGGGVNPTDFLGLVSAQGQGPVTAVSIQTEPGEFATFPVIGLDDPQSFPVPTRLHFPQFANGTAGAQQIVSTLLLVNKSANSSATALVEFRDQDGDAVGAQLFPGSGPSLSLEIPPGGLRSLETNGLGTVVSGSVTVSSDQPLAGVLIYTGNAGSAGVGDSPSFEGGWAAPVHTDLGSGVDTGLAIASLEFETSTIDLTLLDEDGRELGHARLDLPPLGQRALFVDQLEWTGSAAGSIDFSRFAGVIEAHSSGRSSATVIRTRPGQFVVFPVAPAGGLE